MERNPTPPRDSAYLESLIPLARTIAQLLGKRCEVVIHDVADQQSMESTIIAVEGNVTGRRPGGPPTDYLLQRIRSSGKPGDWMVYPGQTPDGRPLRSSTTLIRDSSGTVTGAFCINLDLTDFFIASDALNDLCRPPTQDNGSAGPMETFAGDAEQTFDAILQSGIKVVGKPVGYMSKQDRVILVGQIEERGGFLLRGAVERVARALGVTRCTVYNYLSEARGANPGNSEGRPSAKTRDPRAKSRV